MEVGKQLIKTIKIIEKYFYIKNYYCIFYNNIFNLVFSLLMLLIMTQHSDFAAIIY